LPLIDLYEKRIGYIAGISAYIIWGLLPIYWHSMAGISSWEILIHRIIWAAVLTAGMMTVLGRWHTIAALLKNPRTSLAAMACAVLISINWLVFIWAISVGRTLETSLGYFINPLLNVLVGALILRERLSSLQIAAVICAALGVFYAIVIADHLPWVALLLAASFTGYGFLRKVMMADSLTGLTAETCLLFPFALVGIGWFWLKEGVVFGASRGMTPNPFIVSLFLGAGPVTVAPLLLFAIGARRLPFSTIGFLQYLAPSIAFFISIFIFHELLTTASLITFAFIWAGIGLYVVDGMKRQRATKIIEKSLCENP